MKINIFIILMFSLLFGGCFKEDISLNQKKVTKIFYDETTGLSWQDNNDTKSIKKDFLGALDYCENLKIDKYVDWRLANYTELMSIVDYKKTYPSIDEGFKNVAPFYYWSSTNLESMPSQAFIVSFHSGYTYFNEKKENYYIRCVRGSGLTNKVELIWEDKSPQKGIELNYNDATKYCATLVKKGKSDWRLATIEELQTSKEAPKNVFSDSYWSSSTSAKGNNIAWRVNFGAGYTIGYKKSMKGHIRCVRDK